MLEEDKPGLTRKSYRADSGLPPRGTQYELRWTQQGSVTPRFSRQQVLTEASWPGGLKTLPQILPRDLL